MTACLHFLAERCTACLCPWQSKADGTVCLTHGAKGDLAVDLAYQRILRKRREELELRQEVSI